MQTLYQYSKAGPGRRQLSVGERGLSLPELLIALVVGAILTAIAVPVYNSAAASMRMNSMVGGVTSAISSARYQAVMTSQIYTLTISVPANSYVVKNLNTSVSAAAVPLPSSLVAINGGTAGTYAFTLCPNGTVYGAGTVCPGTVSPPALALTYQSRESDINVSGVGDVSTKIVH